MTFEEDAKLRMECVQHDTALKFVQACVDAKAEKDRADRAEADAERQATHKNNLDWLAERIPHLPVEVQPFAHLKDEFERFYPHMVLSLPECADIYVRVETKQDGKRVELQCSAAELNYSDYGDGEPYLRSDTRGYGVPLPLAVVAAKEQFARYEAALADWKAAQAVRVARAAEREAKDAEFLEGPPDTVEAALLSAMRNFIADVRGSSESDY
jgi:hypothetical protein